MPEANSEKIRKYVGEHIVRQARRAGLRKFSVNAGDVHKRMGLHNRVPSVCAALDSKKFAVENRLKLVQKTGPPSGQSTSVTFVYQFEDQQKAFSPDPLLQLEGSLKEVFRKLGGGENFIRSERRAWEHDEDSKP